MGLDLRTSPYRRPSRVGREELPDLVLTVYASTEPLARGAERVPLEARQTEGGLVLAMPLPLAYRDDVHLAGKGDELVVGVASYRRLLTLPSGVARRRVVGPGCTRASCRSGLPTHRSTRSPRE